MTPDLGAWLRGRSVAVSIDADFFAEPSEQQLVEPLAEWLADCVATGIPATCRRDHVDMIGFLVEPVDLVINFDFHMDLRIEFLHGDAPYTPPQDATVFESVLASGTAHRYLWAHPASRAADAASVYTAAFVAGKQPILGNIHCLPGHAALPLLTHGRTASVFVCRSPGYSTADTDAAFVRLREVIMAAESAR